MRIIRVFPRRTKATPTDEYAFVGDPPLWWPEAEEVHVSVAFTWDWERAYHLLHSWGNVTGLPMKIGGPGSQPWAPSGPSGDFTPGLYLKPGHVITSRGCPNRCWFCEVWKREGGVRELPINEGWNVCDDNLLACSESHVHQVFEMLRRQSQPIVFSGGLEAARLADWHIDELLTLRSPRMYFAYDTPDDLEPLHSAGRRLQEAGFSTAGHRLCCYVLIGYPGDSVEKAGRRLQEAMVCGFFPFAMLWRDRTGEQPQEWRSFQRQWVRPQIVGAAS